MCETLPLPFVTICTAAVMAAICFVVGEWLDKEVLLSVDFSLGEGGKGANLFV